MAEEYEVGIGIGDITGEAGGVGMMGYGMPNQRTAGIHLRQWARAFVIGENRPAGKRIVFVNTDLAMVYIAVHQEVMRRLAERFGDRYRAENVILSATHTHSGPGGFSHYTLYNFTTGGFRPNTFESIVAGIVRAIERADADAAPGSISVSHGDLHEANVNRSLASFLLNPLPDRARYPGAIDPGMTVLRLERGGNAVGVINWFPTHGTSMPNTNRLISSDNKGYAAQLWEQQWAGQDPVAKSHGEISFLAGFAQGNAGDMSPNLGAGIAYGPMDNPFANTKIIGSRQADKARQLFEGPQTPVSGNIDYRQHFVDFSHVDVDPRWTGGEPMRTWPAVVGQGFMAGTWDGPGASFLHQGDRKRHPSLKVLDALIAKPSPELVAAHAPKLVGVATGICKPVPWTPPIIPLQIVKLGSLIIVAAPGEFTITSGYRVRSAVSAELGVPMEQVIFAGYSNGYVGYITTPEEYQLQRYEGGSTHFGPATLPAYQQEFAALAADLRDDRDSANGVEPLDMRAHVWTITPIQRPTDKPGRGREFGDVLSQPAAQVATGEVASAEFVAASPNNNNRNGSSFVLVQHHEPDGTWRTIATDDGFDTMFRWHRTGVHTSRARVSWSVRSDTATGLYRLVYQGDALVCRDEPPVAFEGATRTFAVVD